MKSHEILGLPFWMGDQPRREGCQIIEPNQKQHTSMERKKFVINEQNINGEPSGLGFNLVHLFLHKHLKQNMF